MKLAKRGRYRATYIDLWLEKKAHQERFVRQIELGISKPSDASFGVDYIAKNAKVKYYDVEY